MQQQTGAFHALNVLTNFGVFYNSRNYGSPLLGAVMAIMPFYCFTLKRRFKKSSAIAQELELIKRCTLHSPVIGLVLSQGTHRGRSESRAAVSRHDRKPGKQLPGASESIAGQSDRAHHRTWRRREVQVGIILVSPNAGSSWARVLATHGIAHMLYSLHFIAPLGCLVLIRVTVRWVAQLAGSLSVLPVDARGNETLPQPTSTRPWTWVPD